MLAVGLYAGSGKSDAANGTCSNTSDHLWCGGGKLAIAIGHIFVFDAKICKQFTVSY
jgi:hypothetical protein